METKPGTTTIKEIAKKLKVSPSTVSRALNNNPRIGLKTRMEVQKLAKELNYEPNSRAIFFKQKKTYVIGVVIPFIREEFFSQAISGIESYALDNDYTILFGQSYDDAERELRVMAAMKKQGVDGLIISLSKKTKYTNQLSDFEKLGKPIVFFDRVPSDEHTNRVYCNMYKGTLTMVNWLLGKGYKRIALINGPGILLASKERFKGYMDGLANKKLKVDMQLVEASDLSTESTNKVMEKFLSMKTRPNAIISFNEYVHMDAVKYAEGKGIKINKEIMFASFAHLSITNYTAHPPIISVEQFPYLQGEKAVEMLIRLLSNTNGKAYYKEEIEPQLFVHIQ
ncbi:MAG TPA: LacI family DNA-binding transcriptional regulator [Chitinophagaceae bacterium]|nr:LacI family DNA-binding transcriptional regulator [Chitinophagaceae bacterium]